MGRQAAAGEARRPAMLYFTVKLSGIKVAVRNNDK